MKAHDMTKHKTLGRLVTRQCSAMDPSVSIESTSRKRDLRYLDPSGPNPSKKMGCKHMETSCKETCCPLSFSILWRRWVGSVESGDGMIWHEKRHWNLLSGAKPQDLIAAIRIGLFHGSDQLPGDFEISMTSVFLATSIRIDVSGERDRTWSDINRLWSKCRKKKHYKQVWNLMALVLCKRLAFFFCLALFRPSRRPWLSCSVAVHRSWSRSSPWIRWAPVLICLDPRAGKVYESFKIFKVKGELMRIGCFFGPKQCAFDIVWHVEHARTEESTKKPEVDLARHREL